LHLKPFLCGILVIFKAIIRKADYSEPDYPEELMKQYHVIFHLDEDTEQKVNEVFNNLRNLLSDLGPENVDVELLINGKGVSAMRKDNESNALRIQHLARQGVKFAVCANSIKFLKIIPDDLVSDAEIVPAGVSELVKKQQAGWAYIRP
jgi:intracellular sulfur oxidation DsrE/DsrF family protein